MNKNKNKNNNIIKYNVNSKPNGRTIYSSCGSRSS